MHPKAEEAIGRQLRALLGSAKVDDDGALNIYELNRVVKYFENEVLKHCREWLRLSDVVLTLVDPFLRPVFELRGKMPVPPSRQLSDYIGKQRMGQIFDQVMNDLKALPMSYTGYLLLPLMKPESIRVCELAPGIKLINGNELAAEPNFKVPIAPFTRNALLSALERTPDAGSHVMYLACTGIGFYWSDAGTSGASALLATMKQVLSLLEVTYVIERHSADLSIPGPTPVTQVVVHNDSKRQYETPLTLPNLFRTRAQSLGFTGAVSQPKRRSLLDVGDDEPPVDRAANIHEEFRNAKKCFVEPEQHADILTAAEWAFDAAAEDNQTLSYLYSAIGLEAILGAPEKEITSTLGDRLAYLIGSSRAERRDIQEKFKSFYEHRSKIVHGKRARLRGEEVELMRWARNCIHRAINRELSL